MTSELLDLKGKGLVIVAHPDDETIWMGGTILVNPQVKWTIFSLCRSDDRDRALKFRRACKFLGARALISNLDDEEKLSWRESLLEIRARIRRAIGGRVFDYIFTHGYNGEYGHPRHRGAHQVVKEMIRHGEIKTRAFYNFSYGFDERKGICRSREADVFLKLSPALFKKKKKIVQEIYGFRKSTFEYRTLSESENFKNLRRLMN